MSIDLSPDTMEFIEKLVSSGRYKSANEAVAAGVRLLMSQQQLRADIQRGIRELDAGQGIDGETVFVDLRERAERIRQRPE